MPLLNIRVTTTTGFVHRFALLSESSSIWSSATPRESLFFPYGSQPISGMSVLEMECTGIVLLSTGFICLSSRGYSIQGKPVIPFSVPGP